MPIIKKFESYFRNRQYDEYDLTRYLGILIQEGVLNEDAVNRNFGIVSNVGLNVSLNPGSALIGGDYAFYIEFQKESGGDTIDLVFDLPTTSDRQDLVVLQIDRANETIDVVILKNTVEGNATDPVLTQDVETGTELYQFPLFRAVVSTGATVALTDLRTYAILNEAKKLEGAEKSIDGTFAANSDEKIPTEKATKSYVTSIVGLLSNLDTTTKTSVVNAINELVASLSTTDGNISTLTGRVDGHDTDISGLDGRIDALELIDHDHANKAELDLFQTGDRANLVTAYNHSQTVHSWAFIYAASGNTKIPNSYIEDRVITDVSVVASEAAQLALTAQEGDVAVRTDLSKSYIHLGTALGTMADWQELLSPTDAVQSVAGKTGVVTLVEADITDLHQHANKAILDATQEAFTTALKNKLDGIEANANNYSHPTQAAIDVNTSGAQIIDQVTVNTLGHVTAVTARTLTLADLGYTGDTNANNYVHPSFSNVDINTSGAQVFDTVNFNNGHISAYTLRNMTLADLGYTGATDANNYVHPDYTETDWSFTGAEVLSAVTVVNGHVNGYLKRTLTLANLGYTGATNADNYGSWSFAVNGVTQDAITSGDVLDFVAGSNITITRSADDKITIAGTGDTQLSTEQVQDIVGAMVASNTETRISVTYDDGTGKLNFVVDDMTPLVEWEYLGSVHDADDVVVIENDLDFPNYDYKFVVIGFTNANDITGQPFLRFKDGTTILTGSDYLRAYSRYGGTTTIAHTFIADNVDTAYDLPTIPAADGASDMLRRWEFVVGPRRKPTKNSVDMQYGLFILGEWGHSQGEPTNSVQYYNPGWGFGQIFGSYGSDSAGDIPDGIYIDTALDAGATDSTTVLVYRRKHTFSDTDLS